MWHFFAQPVLKLNDIWQAQFYLLNCGQGYTDVGVNTMTFDAFQFHIGALNKKLSDEDSARKQAASMAKGRKH